MSTAPKRGRPSLAEDLVRGKTLSFRATTSLAYRVQMAASSMGMSVGKFIEHAVERILRGEQR